MPPDFFHPTPEQQNVVLIDAASLQKAQRMIAGCEACSEDAEIPFDYILDAVTGGGSIRYRLRARVAGKVLAVWRLYYGQDAN